MGRSLCYRFAVLSPLVLGYRELYQVGAPTIIAEP